MVTTTDKWNHPPDSALAAVLRNVHDACLCVLRADAPPGASESVHYCSLRTPCAIAAQAFRPVQAFRRVATAWNGAFQLHCAGAAGGFFASVEDVYYPHAWHINARMRAAPLLGRYRVVRTIDEEGDRGVFEALDFGVPGGCACGARVILKVWDNETDGECVVEREVYEILSARGVTGVPALRTSGQDVASEFYILALEKLGPSLQQFLDLVPGGRLNEKMVMALAMRLIDRYEAVHKAGVVHNGVKPGNICLSESSGRPGEINLIDFGLSYFYSPKHAVPEQAEKSVVGNRQFLSILGHLAVAQSPRDDLESLGYLFSSLYHGQLPWNHPGAQPAPGKTTEKHAIWRVKMATPAQTLFAGMDRAFLEYWRDVRVLAYGEEPDYARLQAHFVLAWEGRQSWIESPGEVDWLKAYSELQTQEAERLRQRREEFQHALTSL